MASKYFVGNGTNWSSTSSWATSTGGTPGAAVPTSTDDVYFDANSPGACSIDATANCRSAIFTGYTHTISHQAAIIWNIYGSLTMVFGMIYSRIGSGAAINFAATSTGWTITASSQPIYIITLNGSGGGWILLDSLLLGDNVSSSITLTQGTLNTNNQIVTVGIFASNTALTRVFQFGTSSITVTGVGAAFGVSGNGQSGTVNASTITLTGAGSSFSGGTALAWGTVILNGSGSSGVSNTLSFVNLTRNGVTRGDTFTLGSVTILGTLTVNCTVLTPMLVWSGSTGNPNTLTVTTLVTTGRVDWMDITGAGTAVWSTASGATYFGDCGGNTNITFTTAVPQTWTAPMGLDGTELAMGGVTNSYASTPDATWNKVTGAFTVDVNASLANWAPNPYQALVGKWSAAGYMFYLATNVAGGLNLSLMVPGQVSFWSSVPTGFVNGSAHWVRASFAPSSGGYSRVQFFTSPDGVTWTQLGVDITNAIISSYVTTTATFEFGSLNGGTSNNLNGTLLEAKMYQSALGSGAGTPTLDANFATATAGAGSFVESSTHAATVTISNPPALWSTGNWSSRTPLPQDDVTFVAAANQTITIDTPRIGRSIVFPVGIGSPTLTLTSNFTWYGSLDISGLGSWTITPYQWVAAGRGSYTVTSGGSVMPPGSNGLYITAPGGTYTLADAPTWNCNFYLLAGTFNTNNFNMQIGLMMLSSGVFARSFIAGTSTITATRASAGSIFQIYGTGCTISVASATFVIATASLLRTWDGAGTFGTLICNGVCGITGSNTFRTLQCNPQSSLNLTSGTTQTVTNLNCVGAPLTPADHLVMPGNGYISSPDSALFAMTDMTLDVHLALNDWAQVVTNTPCAKLSDFVNNYQYIFYIASGKPTLSISRDGSNANTYAGAPIVTGFAPGSDHWLRACYKGNNGAGGHTFRFYTSSDGVTWTQLGTTITSAGTVPMNHNAGIVEIGSYSHGSLPCLGSVYRHRIYNSDLGASAGTPIFDADLTNKPFGANSWTESANGATVSITNPSIQMGDGRVQIVSATPGVKANISVAGGIVNTCDYLVLKDIAAIGGAAFYAGDNSIDGTGNTGWFWDTWHGALIAPVAAVSTSTQARVTASSKITPLAVVNASAIAKATAAAKIIPVAASMTQATNVANTTANLTPMAMSTTQATNVVSATTYLSLVAAIATQAKNTVAAPSLLDIEANVTARADAVVLVAVALSLSALASTLALASTTAAAKLAPQALSEAQAGVNTTAPTWLNVESVVLTSAGSTVGAPIQLRPSAQTRTTASATCTITAALHPSAQASTSAEASATVAMVVEPIASAETASRATVSHPMSVEPYAASITQGSMVLTAPFVPNRELKLRVSDRASTTLILSDRASTTIHLSDSSIDVQLQETPL